MKKSIGCIAVAGLLSVACSGTTSPSAVPGGFAGSGAGIGVSGVATAAPAAAWGDAGLSQQLSVVKRATAAFHDFDAGTAAGWGVQATGCVPSMGFHYLNPGLLFDGGALDSRQPEVLLYEPRGDGTLHLVAVEYLVAYGDSATAPTLFGQTFHRNDADGLWILHAWIWKPNPDGMFADLNPSVSCS